MPAHGALCHERIPELDTVNRKGRRFRGQVPSSNLCHVGQRAARAYNKVCG